MNPKILGVVAGTILVIIIIAAASTTLIPPDPEPVVQKTNEKIGLVINSPTQAVSLQQIDAIYSSASSTGIGRSNVYLFWNIIEPQRGDFDWSQSDVLMGLNEKNNLKVTLFFSIINGKTLGPFPDWIGEPSLNAIGEERLVNTLDAILLRYPLIDSVIIAGEAESQFRHYEQNVSVYKNLFSNVYDQLKNKHPDVKFGNSFALHQVLNKNLEHIVDDLAIGDFVAFSYSPVDNLNDIAKTPQEAIIDLKKMFEIVPDKKIALFEISWSTSDFVGGDSISQQLFLETLFDFYSENESEIEFMTWYRYSDKPESTCLTEKQEIGTKNITLSSDSIFGSNEYIVERSNYYICNAGLVDANGNFKSGWVEFQDQIDMID